METPPASPALPATSAAPDTLAGFAEIAAKFGFLCGAVGVPADMPRRPFEAGLRRLFLDELSATERRALHAAAARAFAPPPAPPQSDETSPAAAHAPAV